MISLKCSTISWECFPWNPIQLICFVYYFCFHHPPPHHNRIQLILSHCSGNFLWLAPNSSTTMLTHEVWTLWYGPTSNLGWADVANMTSYPLSSHQFGGGRCHSLSRIEEVDVTLVPLIRSKILTFLSIPGT